MRTTAIKYQDRNQNEVLLATSDTLFPAHFLQKKRQVESSGFRSNHNVSPYNQHFTFTGKEWCKSQWLAQRGLERGISETGYSYFGARYYDSDLSGLFLSVDPMSDKFQSLSPYAYCAWNPIKATDPNGMDSIHTPNGIANAGPGYKVTEDGQYLYGDGLQTKKWNPNLDIGGVVGNEYRGGYENYFGPPIDFNCINSGETIPIKLNNEASTVSCTIPVFISPSFGAFFSEIVTASGNALATAVSSLLIIPACLLFSSDSSPNQNAVRGGHDTNIR